MQEPSFAQIASGTRSHRKQDTRVVFPVVSRLQVSHRDISSLTSTTVFVKIPASSQVENNLSCNTPHTSLDTRLLPPRTLSEAPPVASHSLQTGRVGSLQGLPSSATLQLKPFSVFLEARALRRSVLGGVSPFPLLDKSSRLGPCSPLVSGVRSSQRLFGSPRRLQDFLGILGNVKRRLAKGVLTPDVPCVCDRHSGVAASSTEPPQIFGRITPGVWRRSKIRSHVLTTRRQSRWSGVKMRLRLCHLTGRWLIHNFLRARRANHGAWNRIMVPTQVDNVFCRRSLQTRAARKIQMW